MTSQKIQQAEEARTRLKDLLPPGTTVYTVLRHVSRSGMQRRISVVVPREGEVNDITYLVGRATNQRIHPDGGLIVNGCGMDMGFSVVYNLAATIYPHGFGCIGEAPARCPSNDHSNGDRDYTPHATTTEGYPTDAPRSAALGAGILMPVTHDHWHQDGGYALKQRWI